ncbi:5919_t:CDS:2, partial [Acaulospora morrowiae]
FDSAFADEYDSKQDVFDQIINTLVPTLIIFLFDNEEIKKDKEDKVEDLDEVTSKHSDGANPDETISDEFKQCFTKTMRNSQYPSGFQSFWELQLS